MRKLLIITGAMMLFATGCGKGEEEPKKEQEVSAPSEQDKTEATYKEKFEKVEALRAEKKFAEAKKELQAIVTETKDNEKLKTYHQQAEEKLADITKEEGTRVEKKVEETKKPDPQKKKESVKSTKAEYIAKLDKIGKDLDKATEKLESDTNADMREAGDKKIAAWDKALNEIYGALKTQLPSNEMKVLQEEQRKWNKDKEDRTKKIASQPGTAYPVEARFISAELTQKRCYELVEKYMK
ncbi:lysozyme inhibitor LprI family protein [Priestia taiwanensis]|uniref:Lysozyme inhibitor LprI-like N-terminal domain-containing protein n=1 Tax=Priestia taiwanensis TaxID=1347902 RepID=A0A917ENU6_9BACI|nr:lysozyme inhibitor LprI family protein [Priestia taiwanensis]MBM7363199.1 thioesterase domain-containing protein [Priestia taiwanensis]GGE68473.1 hypothetical protein GCM10007140_18180 [Priestia taiwanensis]